jgi:hypothetical protein
MGPWKYVYELRVSLFWRHWLNDIFNFFPQIEIRPFFKKKIENKYFRILVLLVRFLYEDSMVWVFSAYEVARKNISPRPEKIHVRYIYFLAEVIWYFSGKNNIWSEKKSGHSLTRKNWKYIISWEKIRVFILDDAKVFIFFRNIKTRTTIFK